jgi:hypothetical protein
MDRREFLAGVGLIAAGNARAANLATATGRADGVFAVNPQPLGLVRTADAAMAGLSLGYIPGSAEIVLAELTGQTSSPTWRSLLAPRGKRAEMSILRLMPATTPSIRRLGVTINFALAEPPYYAPFYAWQFVAASGTPIRQSSPISFSANVPDSAIVSVDYQVAHPHSGERVGGTLHYRLGGSGLGPGIYALAAPSAADGASPDWTALACGEADGQLVRRDGGTIDFDYLTLALAPLAG